MDKITLVEVIKFIPRYFWNIVIWVDQGINTILFFGDPDETVSSRMGKYAERGKGWIPCQLCKLFHLLDKDHCKRTLERDEGSRGLF